MPPETVEYRPPKARFIVQAILCLALMALCLWMLFDPQADAEDLASGAIAMVVLASWCALSVYTARGPRAALRLGPERIETVSPFGKTTLSVPYAALAGLRTYRAHRPKCLVLVLLDPEYGEKGLLPVARQVRKLSAAVLGSPFVIVPAYYGADLNDVAAEIERRRAAILGGGVVYPRPLSFLR